MVEGAAKSKAVLGSISTPALTFTVESVACKLMELNLLDFLSFYTNCSGE
jgi:hypothetical protein